MREDQLNSWKIIAQYLGINERTARNYAKELGLPVYRLKSKEKPRVFAYKGEIDSWHQGAKEANNHVQVKLTSRHSKKVFNLIPVAGSLVLLFLLSFSFLNISSDRQPANFNIDNSSLIILNSKEKELWRTNLGLENIEDETIYRRHFQNKYLTSRDQISLPYLIIKDINHDGHNEVLFSIQTKNDYHEGRLICFNYKGGRLWQFKSGRELTYGNISYSADYRISGFNTCDINNDGNEEIILISIHMPYWPCQLAVLDAKGKLLGEYWNSGHFADFECIDLDMDEKREIIAVGQNNEYKKGCLAVFRSDFLKGGSPQKEDSYKSKDLESGSEIYYLLFPRTDVDRLEYPAGETISTVNFLSNNQIQAAAYFSGIYYQFNSHFDFPIIHFSHYFENKRSLYLVNQKIKDISPPETNKILARGILYWDGKEWINQPTMNHLNKGY